MKTPVPDIGRRASHYREETFVQLPFSSSRTRRTKWRRTYFPGDYVPISLDRKRRTVWVSSEDGIFTSDPSSSDPRPLPSPQKKNRHMQVSSRKYRVSTPVPLPISSDSINFALSDSSKISLNYLKELICKYVNDIRPLKIFKIKRIIKSSNYQKDSFRDVSKSVVVTSLERFK